VIGRRPHIGLLAPAAGPVSPTATGSIESLIRTLARGLVVRGHPVTLFAVGDSRTDAELYRTLAHGYDEHDEWWDWQTTELAHAAIAYAAAGRLGIEVMHAHTAFALAAAAAAPFPTLITHHVEISPELAVAHEALPDVAVVCVSRSQARSLGAKDRLRAFIVPHGIDVAAMPPSLASSSSPDAPLVFLGRLLADKGVAGAVEIARRSGRRLVIAGCRVEGDEAEAGLDALLAEPHVDYRGPVALAERDALLASAAALVHPLRYEEPVGLVLIEAMACGTPVLTLDVGACGEIIENDVTGWVGGSIADLVTHCETVVALDRARIRARAAERFGAARMTDRYIELYDSVAPSRGAAPVVVAR
jgi:glycosyltransferase involved in cell wall biosynthesis